MECVISWYGMEWRIEQANQLETAALLIRWQQPNKINLRLNEDLTDSNVESLMIFLTATNTHYTEYLSLNLERSHKIYQALPEDILLHIKRGRLVLFQLF